MKFVEQRGQGDKDYRSQVRVDAPATIEPQGPIDERGEDEILGDVSELANDSMQEIDSGRCNARQQKLQYRLDES